MLYRRRGSRRRRNRTRLLCSAALFLIVVLAVINRPNRATMSTRGADKPAPVSYVVGAGVRPSMKEWYVPDRYRGVVVRDRPKGFTEKVVALTFDDGPSRKITPRVLDILRTSEVRATFFIIGCMAEERPDMLREIAEQGHAIGNHSWRHTRDPSPAAVSWELIRTDGLIRDHAGHAPMCYRPPYGIRSFGYTPEALRMGYSAITWTIPAPYGKGATADVITNQVTRSIHPGDIILMHDGPGHATTIEALPNIIRRITAKGYRFVTVPELLQAWDRWESSHPEKH